MNAYRVRDWNKRFENNRTRDLKRMDWVPIPNQHDGDGYTDLINRPNGVSLYGAWTLILQVASKCDARGTLLRDGQKPHCARSISRMTQANPDVIQQALDACLEIGWLEVIQVGDNDLPNPAPSCAATQDHSAHRRVEVTMEWNGREGKGMEGKEGNIKSSAGDYPKTPAEAIAHGQFIGCPPEQCEAFWYHFDAQGWVNKHGIPIANWKSKLASWKIQAQQDAAQAKQGGKKRLTIFELKAVIEEKMRQATEIKNKFSSPTACGVEWMRNEEAIKAREECAKLWNEIRGLRAQLGSSA